MNGSHATALAVLASFAITSQSIAAEGNPALGQLYLAHVLPAIL